MTRESLWWREEDNKVKSKKDDSNLLSILIRDYVDEKSRKGDVEFTNFFDEITSKDSNILDENIKKELEIFKSKNEKFTWLNIKWITYFDLQRETIRAWIGLKTRREELEEIFKNFYEFWDSSYLVKLSNEIKKLSKRKLDSMLTSEFERKEFINKNFTHNIPKLKKDKKVFETIWLNFDSLSDAQKEAAKNFYNSWLQNKQVLFELINNFTDTEQKRKLITKFMPTITLAKLIDLEIIDSNKADDIIFESLKSRFPNIKEEKKKDFIGYINKDDFVVSSNSFLADNNNLNKIISDNKFEWLFDDVEKIDKKAQENKEIEKPKNREEFIKKIKENQENSKLGNIDLFWDNIYFEWLHNEDWIEKKLYLKIENIHDNWTLDIKELTHKSWIYRESDVKIRNIKYEKFEDTLSYFIYWLNRWAFSQKEDFNERIKNWNLQEFPDSKTVNSLSDLNINLNNLDKDWEKFWIQDWTVFTFKQWENKEAISVAKITKVDEINKTISITNWARSTFTFSEFLEAFESEDAKRVAVIKDKEQLINSLKDDKDTKDWFKELIYDKDTNKLLPKNQEKNKKHPWVKYFVNKDKKALKIEEIKDNEVIVSTWEYEEWIKWKDWKKEKWDNFKWSKSYSMSHEMFFAYMKKNKLEAKIFPEDIEITENPNSKELSQSRSASKWFFGMQNFVTISMWVKQWMNSIKDTLKENNELEAAKFALQMWFMLPDSMKSDLQSRVEWVQKKKMWEKISQLEWMNPWLVMKQVMKILTTKNTHEHELEATLMYVIKKHWTLYPDDLYEYKWSYLWYKKLWWKIWDSLYNEYVKERIQNWLPIVEEELIIKLLREQWKHDSKYYPKRRTTIASEFDGNFSSWRKVKDAGKSETDWKVTRDWREAICIDSFKNWKHLYAIWALESTLDRWGWLVEKNKVPFMIIMSWLTWKLNESDAKSLGWIANKYGVPILSFGQNPNMLSVFERWVIKMAKNMWDKKMEEWLLEIKKMKDTWASEKDILDKTEKFWWDFGKKLAPKLVTNDYEIHLWWEDNDSEIKDYLWIVWVSAAYHSSDESQRNTNADNKVYDDDHTFLYPVWWAGWLKKMIWEWWQKIKWWYQRKNFETLIKRLNWIKKDTTLDESQKKKLFNKFNKDIVEWISSSDSRNLSREQLEKLDWWRELLQTWVWIPTKAEKDNFWVKDLDSDFSKTKLSEWYKRYNWDYEKEFKNTIKLKSDTILKVDTILKNWKYSKEEAQKQAKKKENQNNQNSFDPSDWWFN